MTANISAARTYKQLPVFAHLFPMVTQRNAQILGFAKDCGFEAMVTVLLSRIQIFL
jgi:hypothetical protein